MTPINGQCHCKAISFTALVDHKRVVACHCTDCQTLSGGPFLAILPVPAADMTLHGQPKVYIKTADSGNRRIQAFCGDCGTKLYSTDPDKPEVLNLRLGCVAQRAQLPPVTHIFGRSAMPWLADMHKAPMHEAGMSSALMASKSNQS